MGEFVANLLWQAKWLILAILAAILLTSYMFFDSVKTIFMSTRDAIKAEGLTTGQKAMFFVVIFGFGALAYVLAKLMGLE